MPRTTARYSITTIADAKTAFSVMLEKSLRKPHDFLARRSSDRRAFQFLPLSSFGNHHTPSALYEKHERWITEVRDPAILASEGVRRIEVRNASAEYEIAHLPDGQWAMHTNLAFRAGDYEGSAMPWQTFSTRERASILSFVAPGNTFHGRFGTATTRANLSHPKEGWSRDDEASRRRRALRVHRARSRAMIGCPVGNGGAFSFPSPSSLAKENFTLLESKEIWNHWRPPRCGPITTPPRPSKTSSR